MTDDCENTGPYCWIRCSIFVVIALIILIILAALIIWFLIDQYKKRFKQNYMLNTITYCAKLEPIKYTSTVSKPEQDNLYEYRLARALLEASILVSQSNCTNISVTNPEGFNQQTRIITSHPKTGNNRMVATVFSDKEESTDYANRILIVFSGTFFLDEWATDMNFPLTDATDLRNYIPGVKLHTGFYNLYQSARKQLWSIIENTCDINTELYITGHSLGGALATISAYDFARYKPVCYTFASPRTGNNTFANTFNRLVPNCMRIYNIDDTITNLPLPIMAGNVYQHVNSGIAFDINMGNLRDNHITAYVKYLPECIPNVAPCPTSIRTTISEQTNVPVYPTYYPNRQY